MSMQRRARPWPLVPLPLQPGRRGTAELVAVARTAQVGLACRTAGIKLASGNTHRYVGTYATIHPPQKLGEVR
jgi:hypothetical protein